MAAALEGTVDERTDADREDQTEAVVLTVALEATEDMPAESATAAALDGGCSPVAGSMDGMRRRPAEETAAICCACDMDEPAENTYAPMDDVSLNARSLLL